MIAKKKVIKKKKVPSLPKNLGEMKELSTGKVIYKGKELDEREINDIIRTAKGLADNYLLVDLIGYVENEAAKKIYYTSKTLEELSYGKGMLFALDLLKKKIINAAKIKI